jgi:hypothetical protein
MVGWSAEFPASDMRLLVDGRKMVVMASMTDADGNVLSEASGLMVKLLPHQP